MSGAEYGEAKRWPPPIMRKWRRLGFMRLASVVVRFTKDAAVAAQINQLSDNGCVDLSGKTSITEAIDLLASADAVISNDSGLMHVAAALNKKLIALYGSSDPRFTPR